MDKQLKLNNDFIERSKVIHGDKYDYSKVHYVTNKDKVDIYCKEHDFIFSVRPKEHYLDGRQCPYCSGHKLHINEFIEKSNKIHDNKYDYSKVKFSNIQTIVEVGCSICNIDFKVKVGEHYKNGVGCPTCPQKEKLSNSNLTLEIIQERSDKLHNSEYTILGEYTTYDVPILTRHKVCGYEWNMPLRGHFDNMSGCPLCAGNAKLDNKSFQESSNNIHNSEYLLMSDYKTSHEYVELKHIKCGNMFKVRSDNHLYNKTGCPKCNGGVRFSDNDAQININDTLDTTDYKLLEYNGFDNKCLVEHTCGEKYMVYYTNLLNGVSKCPCIGNTRWDKDKFIEKTNEIHGVGQYELISEFTNIENRITMKHLICNHTWELSPKKFIYAEQGCPNCKSSHGEKDIKMILDEFSINYIKEHKFSDCVDKRELPFDFYLPELNILIEYDGIQHFEPVSFFGGEEGFLKTKQRDEIKTKYCLDNNIKLVRIPYNENVREILVNFLNL